MKSRPREVIVVRSRLTTLTRRFGLLEEADAPRAVLYDARHFVEFVILGPRLDGSYNPLGLFVPFHTLFK